MDDDEDDVPMEPNDSTPSSIVSIVTTTTHATIPTTSSCHTQADTHVLKGCRLSKLALQVAQQHLFRTQAATAASCIYDGIINNFAKPLYDKIPYHTCPFTGQMWVNDLLAGHPE
ncbi:hypothetical protein K439DRAFT_1517570 [Ramaria rubella]|nr:hypothetical protein K439DRAFT_1517570 [Ramaria rubella]